jgi:Holliday junction resolvase
MSNKRRVRGFSHERELLVKLWNKGFAVIRAPASGARARRYHVPDIVAIKNGKIFALEVKTSLKERTIYIPKHQVINLEEFVKRAGGIGFIAVKIVNKKGWRFINIKDLTKTRNENYKIKQEMLSKGYKLSDLVAIASGNKRLDDFNNI